MATKTAIKKAATKGGAPSLSGIGSPSLRTMIFQPKFKCVAHCSVDEDSTQPVTDTQTALVNQVKG